MLHLQASSRDSLPGQHGALSIPMIPRWTGAKPTDRYFARPCGRKGVLTARSIG